MIGEYGKFVWLSYLGVSLSIVASYLIIQNQLTMAMILFIGSGICDLFDGQLARSLKRSKEQEAFGMEIDSLADMINFVMLPLVLTLTQVDNVFLAIIISIFYAIASISRLAYFNRSEKLTKKRLSYFTGLPLAYSALVFPLVYLLIINTTVLSFATFITISLPVLAILYVLNISIPKPNKLAYIIYVILAIVTVIGLAMSL